MSPAAVSRRKPPLLLVRIANPVMRTLLQSPLHRPVSNALLVLHLTGRKTGRRYDIVLGYQENDGQLQIQTSSPWRVNLRGGTDVEVTLKGRQQPMRAELNEDSTSVALAYQAMIAELGWKAAQRRLGLAINVQRTPTLAELEEAVAGNGLSILTLSPVTRA